jgi:hypothetical protein
VSTDRSFKGDEESMEAVGGEGADLALMTNQGAQTTMLTSGTQAQAPNPIVVVINVAGNVTKGE